MTPPSPLQVQLARDPLVVGAAAMGLGAVGTAGLRAAALGAFPWSIPLTLGVASAIQAALAYDAGRSPSRAGQLGATTWLIASVVMMPQGELITAWGVSGLGILMAAVLGTLTSDASPLRWGLLAAVGWWCGLVLTGLPPVDRASFVAVPPLIMFGTVVLLSRVAHALRDDGKALRDALTRAERQRARADAASRAKSDFLANMSHELRTPLNAIIGYSELLQEELTGPDRDQLVKDAQRIHQAGRHLLGLINRVLDFSKVEAGEIALEWTAVDVDALVRDACTMAGPQIATNRNALVLDIEEDLLPVRSDPQRLHQCVLNLLANAAKFTTDGTITVRVHREGEEVVLSVSDTGIGLAEDEMERVFEPFQQANANTPSRYGGTGLGLPITRTLTTALGGALGVDSAPGQGATFWIRLPA